MKHRFNLQHVLALRHAYPITYKQVLFLYDQVQQLDELPMLPQQLLLKVFKIGSERLAKMLGDFNRFNTPSIMEFYFEKQIHLIPFWGENYPSILLRLIDPPVFLFTKGDIQLLNKPYKIACIGSRKATQYSLEALSYLLPPIVQKGAVVVSGLAKGADTLAHTMTMQYGGKTIAVLGHGLQMIYPKENEKVAKLIGMNHLLLSEYTFFEGPKKYTFPMRNRIISGISDGLLVTEAGVKSGTLITTEHALEHGKDVFVVPGPITSRQSEGTNKLIREGAIPVWNGYQIVEELWR